MMSLLRRTARALIAARTLTVTLAWAGLMSSPAPGDPLPALTLDADTVTVSGLSSGAFMAVQLQVAFSDRIAGAAVIAGGPYYCAHDRVLEAISTCMTPRSSGPDITELLRQADSYAQTGAIADLAGVQTQRIYMFSGTEDKTVTRPVMDALAAFYEALAVPAQNIQFRTDIAAGHGFLSNDATLPCDASQTPFIIDCDLDQAGELLTWLYGPLAAPVPPHAVGLRRFDQAALLGEPARFGMAETGFVYVPTACANGARCDLHIALHGCRQSVEQIGETYPLTTGFLGWAEANNIVLLFPQARQSILMGNPKGCWDWWGYSDPDYATRQGPQPAAIALMAAELGAPLSPGFCVDHEAFYLTHWQQGRAEPCGLSFCAVGSGDIIGFGLGAATLYESPPGVFSTTACSR